MSHKPCSVKYVVFDAADTLIHKPQLFQKFSAALLAHGVAIHAEKIARRHKIISECTQFPDRTSRDFYRGFNRDVLTSLGVVSSDALLEDIFQACSYLPWANFPDTAVLSTIDQPLAVISNFNATLPDLLNGFFGDVFEHIFVSELLGIAKPELGFYQKALEKLGCAAEEVIYIGDSVRLDMTPASALGMRACLIDRHDLFDAYGTRLTTLAELPRWLNQGAV